MRTNMNPTRFGPPGMGQGTEALYSNIYGESGTEYVEVLRDTPYEMAVISRLLAYLNHKWKGGC